MKYNSFNMDVYKATFFQDSVNEHTPEVIRQRDKWVAKNGWTPF